MDRPDKKSQPAASRHSEAKPSGKRAAPVPYRPPEKLREEFFVRAKNSGLSTNAFITHAVFGKGAVGSAPVNKKELAHILSLAAQINARLSGIAGESSEAQSAVLAQCKEELSSIRQAVMELLGKRS